MLDFSFLGEWEEMFSSVPILRDYFPSATESFFSYVTRVLVNSVPEGGTGLVFFSPILIWEITETKPVLGRLYVLCKSPSGLCYLMGTRAFKSVPFKPKTMSVGEIPILVGKREEETLLVAVERPISLYLGDLTLWSTRDNYTRGDILEFLSRQLPR